MRLCPDWGERTTVVDFFCCVACLLACLVAHRIPRPRTVHPSIQPTNHSHNHARLSPVWPSRALTPNARTHPRTNHTSHTTHHVQLHPTRIRLRPPPLHCLALVRGLQHHPQALPARGDPFRVVCMPLPPISTLFLREQPHGRPHGMAWHVTHASNNNIEKLTCPPPPSVDNLCGDCNAKNQPPVPWEDLIKRHRKHTAISL